MAPPSVRVRDPRGAAPETLALTWGALLLVGPALGIRGGLLPGLVVLGVALGFAQVRTRRLAAIDPEALPRGLRWVIGAALLGIAGVLAGITTRLIATLLVTTPAIVGVVGVALVVAVVSALIVPRLGRRRGLVTGIGLIAAVAALPPVIAGGVRFEAGAVDGRGAAISGPILGIHPFQTTAIVIDGYGPFDLPFNDYVEPDGSRGYSPETYAAAFQRALRRIAAVHFADGSPRAYEAFAGARVEAFTTASPPERLDRPADPEPVSRIQITSGSTGQRSRVELVCPGSRSDPHGLGVDPVMQRMCPDRYASEGSAGLGLTGRWTGYSELRGNARLSLGRLLGGAWVRADDRLGLRARRWEIGLLALGLLVLATFGFAGGRGQRAARGVATWGAAILAIAGGIVLVAIVAGFAAGARPRVGLVDAIGGDPWTLAAWLPIAVLVAGFGDLLRLRGLGPEVDRGSERLPGSVTGLVTGLVPGLMIAATTLATATWLGSIPWITPDLWDRVRPGAGAGAHLLPLEAWVIELGAEVHRLTGWGIDHAEAAVASGLLAGLLGLLASVLQGLPAAAGGLFPRGIRARWLAAPGIAGGLLFSLQTHGGALLLGGALVLAGLIATVLASFASPAAPGDPASEPRPWPWLLATLALGAIALWAVLDTLGRSSRPGPILSLAVLVGLLLTLGIIGLTLREHLRSPPPAGRGPSVKEP